MGCFSCFKHDPSEDDLKTATKISLYSEEDRLVRQKREEEKEEIEMDRATKESLKQAEEDEAKRRLLEKSKKKGKGKQVDDDDDHHVEGKRQIKLSKDMHHPPSICNGCKFEIGDGVSVNPQCSCCLHCHKPIAIDETAKKGKFHKGCYKEHRTPNCYVCNKKIPLTKEGRKFSEHEFWKEKYCPSHEDDGSAPKCCSCERLESCGTKYVMLADGRWLCRECLECAVMDTVECHHLHMEMRDFFVENLNMKIEKEFPLLLVEKEALNKAEKEEKIDNNYGMVTRGICLSEEQMVNSVTKWRIEQNKQLIEDMDRKSQMVERKCEVTAILILYGLPRLLTGYILAHEMMHAWLRLKGYTNLDTVLEEGLCQVVGHMWLEPQTYATTDVTSAAAAASSSSRTPPAKKGDPSDFEKKLVKFCKYQIEADESPVYGVGFKKVSKMMESNDYNLKDTLNDIVSASKTLPDSKF